MIDWKAIWNKFVSGFETGVWNGALFVSGLVASIQPDALSGVIPPKFGPWLIGIGTVGAVCRYFIDLPWFQQFKPQP